jgi:hypothetical protein
LFQSTGAALVFECLPLELFGLQIKIIKTGGSKSLYCFVAIREILPLIGREAAFIFLVLL